jgi:hypothetical protein
MENNCNDIPRWVSAINDDPDLLHTDYTPAVHRLSECGLTAAQAILPLLNSTNEQERLRAQRVLEGVIKRRFGWQSGQGFTNYEVEQNYIALMQLNGNYQADAPEARRLDAIKSWNHWLSQNTGSYE